MTKYHEAVLLNESIKNLNINPQGVYVDATFGGGGHSKEILKYLSNGKLIAFDQDQESCKNKIKGDNRFQMINTNFRNLKNTLESLGVFSINGLIADLGVSAYQFTNNNRGFSLQYDSTIDMRMDITSIKNGVTVLNNYDRENLNRIFKNHADFKKPNSITSAIIKFRQNKKINTTFDFKSIFKDFIPHSYENKFFARLFQAIRIEVNDEIDSLKELLKQTKELLCPKGRLVVISYHSIEDRIVKNFIKFGNFYNQPEKDFFGQKLNPFNIITKKPITPSRLEIKMNNKSRSAKLRVCEKL